MRAHNRPLFRLTATTALTSMLLTTMVPAYAQVPPAAPLPEPAPAAAPGFETSVGLKAIPVDNMAPSDAQTPQEPAIQESGDPPGRVGRVASITGTVSFHQGDADHWEFATQNFPVTSGHSFWTSPNAATDIEAGGARFTLDQSSQFTVDTLDDQTLNTTLALGRMFVSVRILGEGQAATIRTPRGTVSITQPGHYEITVGDTQSPTLLTVVDGAAEFNGPGVEHLAVGSKQTGQISGADPFDGIVVSEVPDDFLERQMARLRPGGAIARAGTGTSAAFAPVAAATTVPADLPPVVREMTGYDAVASTGQWQQTPDYGQVWYPPVAPDWVPYRQGRWSYVAPWGWTWVDDAAWGFAPFHYGRWAQIGPRWGWIPVAPDVVVSERPVYSPALVTFLGVTAGVAVGVGIGAAVGWIPLGPREVYRPPYAVSNNYYRRVNVTNVTNVTNITRVNNNTNYVNNNYRTVVPTNALQRSLPVAQQYRAAPQLQTASLQPQERAQVPPTLATRGATPAAIKSYANPRPAGLGAGSTAAPGTAVGTGAGTGAGGGSGVGLGAVAGAAAVGVGVGAVVGAQGRPANLPGQTTVPGTPALTGPNGGRLQPGAAGQSTAASPQPAGPGGRPAIPPAAATVAPQAGRPTTQGAAPPVPSAAAAGVSPARPGQPPLPGAQAGAAQPGAVPHTSAVPQPGRPALAQPLPVPQAAAAGAGATPQGARPNPQLPAPASQAAPNAPQLPRPAPQQQAPQVSRPPPQPAPQMARPAPPPQPAPQMARPAPPPQPAPQMARPAPPPQPAPQPRPAPARVCPPGRPSC